MKSELVTTITPDALTDLNKVQQLPQGQLKIEAEFLHTQLAARVRGQAHAVKALADEVARHAAKSQPRRPLSLFLTGPTGVGKTLLTECLADALSSREMGGFGWLRLDMCEYQESHRVSQLLGAPQGYVGHGDGAQLTDTLRSNPRTIVLFDEIEKAHPNIFRTLMNAMDAGRLSAPKSGDGKCEIDCRQAIFCFTSNLDASGIINDLRRQDAISDSRTIDEVCRNRLRSKGIPAELIGRITRFLPFMPLDQSVRAEIITLSIRELGTEYGLDVRRIEPEVITLVLNESCGNTFGARPDEFLIDQMLGMAFAGAVRESHAEKVSVVLTDNVVSIETISQLQN